MEVANQRTLCMRTQRFLFHAPQVRTVILTKGARTLSIRKNAKKLIKGEAEEMDDLLPAFQDPLFPASVRFASDCL